MRIRFLLIAAVMAVTAVIAPAATASAQTTAPSAEQSDIAHAANTRELWLKFPTDAGAESCKTREIYLAADEYYWGHRHSGFYIRADRDEKHIYLAAGWYVWKDCIFAPSVGSTYYHDTYLRRKTTGAYATLDRVRMWATDRGTFWAEYGSSLTAT